MIDNISRDDFSTPEAHMDDLRRAFPPGAEPPFRTPVTVLVANARRRGRRRRIARLSAKTALGAASAVAAVVMVVSFSSAMKTTAVVPPAALSRAPSTSPSPRSSAVPTTYLPGMACDVGAAATVRPTAWGASVPAGQAPLPGQRAVSRDKAAAVALSMVAPKGQANRVIVRQMSFADLQKVSGGRIVNDPYIAASRCMWLVTIYGQFYIDVPAGVLTNVSQDANVVLDTATGHFVAEVGGIALQ